MKKRNIILAILPVLLAIVSLQSCKVEDGTLAVFNAFTQPVMTTVPATRADGFILFTGSTVTLNWASTDKDGDPVSWNVYYGTDATAPALFKTGHTTNSIVVPVVDGTTYYWYVEIVDAHKVKTTSEHKEFTAVNGTNPEISIGLSCTTNVLSAIGLNLTPDKVVDLRFLVMKKSDLSIVATVDDGAESETYGDLGTLADGDYVLGVDIYSTINAGDFNKAVNLSLALQFDQLGMINQKLDFPNVMTNANACNLYRTYLVNINKAGAKYTITNAVSYMTPPVVTWKGWDTEVAEASKVTTTASCAGKTMTGLGFGWMAGYWGEIITSGGTLSYTVSGTAITIPLQKYCKTTYKGVAQPEYYIQGTGTIDNSGAFPVWTIRYDFKQGTHWVALEPDYGGWSTRYFEAKLTTNPAGL